MPMGERCGPSTNTEVATQKGSRVVKKKGEGKMQASRQRSGQVRLALMLIIGVAAAAACVAALLWWKAPVDPAQAATQPNIIFILTDDMRKDDLNPTYMPQTTKQLVEKGMSFQNAFVSNPLCCPSRATIMRGQYGHNTKIWFNTNIFDPDPNVNDGGWLGYNGNGYEKDNVATHLKAAGYRTGLFGKYLNGYSGATDNTPPLGWNRWFAFKTLHYYGYDVNDNGTIKHFGSKNSDYSTNVLNTQVQDFIRTNAAPGKPPIFAYVAPYAPHDPAKPGPGDQTTFNGIKAPRAPISFNEQDVTDKPPWIQSLRRLTSDDIANIDQRHENRIESLQAVDDLVAAVVSTLGQQGVLSNTYIVFTSDNGFHHGEHRIRQGKARPYEESVRVPLVISGPSVAAGSTTDNLVLNTDYFPTFMDLAGAQTPSYVDGRSLVPLLEPPPPESAPPPWRTAILIEGRGSGSDPEIEVDRNYNAVRTSTSKYVEYEGGFRELYNLSPPGTPGADPNEVANSYNPTTPPTDLVSRLQALKSCAGSGCFTAENGP